MTEKMIQLGYALTEIDEPLPIPSETIGFTFVSKIGGKPVSLVTALWILIISFVKFSF